MAEDRRIIHEITPLMGKDVLYIADRHKKEFTYPIHNHSVFELNFVENAAGVKRIVGDSQEVIGDFDLCLITSPDLEHVWEQNVCRSEDIREITIQFDFSMGGGDSLRKKSVCQHYPHDAGGKEGALLSSEGDYEGLSIAGYPEYSERWLLCRAAVSHHSL